MATDDRRCVVLPSGLCVDLRGLRSISAPWKDVWLGNEHALKRTARWDTGSIAVMSVGDGDALEAAWRTEGGQ